MIGFGYDKSLLIDVLFYRLKINIASAFNISIIIFYFLELLIRE